MERQRDGWMDGRMDGWMDRRMFKHKKQKVGINSMHRTLLKIKIDIDAGKFEMTVQNNIYIN